MRHYKKNLNLWIIISNKLSNVVLVLGLFSFISLESLASEISTSQQYDIVKQAIFEKPYSQRPNYVVSRKLFGKTLKNKDNKLLAAAKRTLTDSRDLIDFPDKQKLLQANGICFSGIWNIDKKIDLSQTQTKENNFTGLFAPGTFQAVIVRASVALSGTTQKDKRAFGMAIKFFPSDLTSSSSLNAFLLHSFGGVVSKYVLDLSMDNQPTLGSLPKFSDLGTALRLKKDLEKADRAHGAKKARFSFRPITHLASYQNKDSENTVPYKSPKWLRLVAKTTQRIDSNDFRDELAVSAYPDKLIVYTISVAEESNKKSQAQWQNIGQLILNESITSATCDQRLHFQHPKLN